MASRQPAAPGHARDAGPGLQPRQRASWLPIVLLLAVAFGRRCR